MRNRFVKPKNSPSDGWWLTDQGCTAEQWRRWDEEMVNEFALWIARLGKSTVVATAILLSGVFVGLFS